MSIRSFSWRVSAALTLALLPFWLTAAELDVGGWPSRPADLSESDWTALKSAMAITVQQAKLMAADGLEDDEFGKSVALSGDLALVGAYGDDIGANWAQGSAYVFARSGTTWVLQAKLVASDGAPSDVFGTSVALLGDTALIGASGDAIGANSSQGSAYVFVRNGTTWVQQAKLVASDGGLFDGFGESVALSASSALVGSPFSFVGTNGQQGSAYVFVRIGTIWAQQAKLVAADGTAFDQLGRSVALSGDTALLGAHRSGGNQKGSAYAFVRNGTAWGQQAKLLAPDGALGDWFGWSVALSGDTALVGAPEDDIGSNSNQGSAYSFVRTGTTWVQQAKLLATDGAVGDQFGKSVAVSDDTALVGASLDDIGVNINEGSAYVFVRSASSWLQQAKLLAVSGQELASFGGSVALSGNSALVGAELENIGGNLNQGAAYVHLVPSVGDPIFGHGFE